MEKYTLVQFIEDCKSLGWYDKRVGPAWMDEMDITLQESDLEKVLMYNATAHHIPVIMDYSDSNKGIRFSLSQMGDRMGSGRVTNTPDLMVYLKVTGYNRGVIPKKSRRSKKIKTNKK